LETTGGRVQVTGGVKSQVTTGRPGATGSDTGPAEVATRFSIGVELERLRSELSACAEDLSAALSLRSGMGVQETAGLLRRLTCKIAVIGQVKAGKSSFINALVGRPGLLPTHVNPWTTAVTHLHFGRTETPADCNVEFTFFERDEWQRLAEGGGRIRELTERLVPGFEEELLRHHVEAMRRRSVERLGTSLDTLLGQRHQFPAVTPDILEQYICSGEYDIANALAPSKGLYSDIVKQADLYFPTRDFGFPTTVIDTPGTNDPFIVRDEITRRNLEAADIYVVVLTARQALSTADLSLLRILRGLHRDKVAIFINRIDELGDIAGGGAEIVERVREGLQAEFPGWDMPIVKGSAHWALAAMRASEAELTKTLSPKVRAYAAYLARQDGEAATNVEGMTSGPIARQAQALLTCSGMPALYDVLAKLTLKSHAGHVMRQVARSFSELSSFSDAALREEVSRLQSEQKNEAQRYQTADQELRQINAEINENERLTVAVHNLVVDMQARTDQIINEECAELHAVLHDTVAYYSRHECGRLEEAIRFGTHEGQWVFETDGLRHLLEQTFVKSFRQAESAIGDLENVIFPKLRGLLAARLPEGTQPTLLARPLGPGELPSFDALSENVVFDVTDPWWKRWWIRRLPVEERLAELDATIRQQFEPVVASLVRAAQARLKAQQSTMLKNSTVVFLSLVEFLQERSQERLERTRELLTERAEIEQGKYRRARANRLADVERQMAAVSSAKQRIERIERSWDGLMV